MINFFQQTETTAATHIWTLELHEEAICELPNLAAMLADAIVQTRCIRCSHHYLAWRAAVEAHAPPIPPSSIALQAFIRPILGLPEEPKPVDHVEGYVAQFLWYSMRLASAEVENAVRIESPGYSPTDPGGDGLVIHRLDDKSLMFRLWEIKKVSGTSTVSSTVRAAYKQLDSRATEYLARFVAIGQEQADPELAEFYGQLLDLWIDASPQAAAGVAVALSAHAIPKRCFTTLGKRFPQLADPVRLRGILTALSDFRRFATLVRDEVWKGL